MNDRRFSQTRLRRLRLRMAREDLDGIIITDQAQLRYLVGYSGSNGLLLVWLGRAEFFTDGRYREHARREVRGATISIGSGDLVGNLGKVRSVARGRPRIGYESHLFSEKAAQRLRAEAPRALFIPFDDLVSPLMQVKDSGELGCIRQAAAIADRAFAAVLPVIKPGIRECDVAAELEYSMTKAGSEKVPFETIVASGPRSALPHGRASMRRIRHGDFVTMDFGATARGYVSDITRTVVVGRATARQRRVYRLVQRAQKAAADRAAPGIACADLDRTARRIIERAGLGRRFDHGLGHGIGLAVHEGPAVNARSRTLLRSGMVVAIEPGVYIPGWGGVRIEDDVVIRPGGAALLTRSDRSLLEL